jgi:hypothetical protein
MSEIELGNYFFGHSKGGVPIPRGAGWEDQLKRLFDAYAPDRDRSWRDYGDPFENDTFCVAEYWWGDCTCGAVSEHKPDCKLMVPNFLYKPTGFAIEWYKYPLRDSYMNFEITLDEFTQIIDKCIASLGKTK